MQLLRIPASKDMSRLLGVILAWLIKLVGPKGTIIYTPYGKPVKARIR